MNTLYDLVMQKGTPNNERAEWVYDKVNKFARQQKREIRILDIACADGTFANLFHTQVFMPEIDAVDKKLIIRPECQHFNINYIEGDIFDFKPKNNRKYDVIFCGELCEHLPEGQPEKLMKLINGWLKKNGILILTVPNFYIKSGGHLRVYDEDSMLELVKNFKVIEIACLPKERFLFHCCVCEKK